MTGAGDAKYGDRTEAVVERLVQIAQLNPYQILALDDLGYATASTRSQTNRVVWDTIWERSQETEWIEVLDDVRRIASNVETPDGPLAEWANALDAAQDAAMAELVRPHVKPCEYQCLVGPFELVLDPPKWRTGSEWNLLLEMLEEGVSMVDARKAVEALSE